ncbi:PaaI family thioesterase [Erysipelotrichaceae bacterium RD49]|nr:PaaI family thioesterase [Erysipelotrichaceae bacterium RD49]
MEDRFAKIKEGFNASNGFLKTANLRVVEVEQDHAIVMLDAGQDELNIYGMVHGGVYFTLADTAAGICALTNGPDVVTLDSSMNFIHAGKPGPLTAHARTIHAGKSTGVYQVNVFDAQNQLLATALFTMYFFRTSKPHAH